MSDNLESFTRELARLAESMPAEQVAIVHRALHLDALGRIVQKTPVDEGRTRGNWQSTIGAPATGQLPLRSEAEVLAEGARVASEIAPFGVSYITNNVDHILVLELGEFDPPDPGPSKDPRPGRKGRELVKGGYSVQAPRGMVAVTVEELAETFKPEGS